MAKTIPQNGIQPLPIDNRDLLLAGFFDQIDVKTIPLTDFETREPLIKDQHDTDYCSSYAVTGVSEDQELVELVPEFQFYVTKLISGDPDAWGADLRSACMSAVKYGSLPRYVIEGKYIIPNTRELVLNKDSWLEEWFAFAREYRKETVFKITGRYDIFDNIRVALFQFKEEKRSIVVGASWKPSWTEAEGGIIKELDTTEEGFGHAFKIYGQKIINGVPYLKAQLSNGTKIGDRGVFYFSREVVNEAFKPYGQFMFKDISRETIKVYRSQGVKATDFFTIRWWAFIKHFLNIK